MPHNKDIQDAINTGTDQAFILASPQLRNISQAAHSFQSSTNTPSATIDQTAQQSGGTTQPSTTGGQGGHTQIDYTKHPDESIQEYNERIARARGDTSIPQSNVSPQETQLQQEFLTDVSDTSLLGGSIDTDPRIQPDLDTSAGDLDRFKRVGGDRIFEQRGNQLVEVTDPSVKQQLNGVALDAFANVNQAASTVKKGFDERGINADSVNVIEGGQQVSQQGRQAIQGVGSDRLQTAAQETQQNIQEGLTAARPSSGQTPQEARDAINNLPAGGRNLTPEEIQAIAAQDFIDDTTRQRINDVFQPITGRTTDSFTVGDVEAETDDNIPDFNLPSGSTISSQGLGGDTTLGDIQTQTGNFLENLNTIQSRLVEATTPSEAEVELEGELQGITQAARERRESARNRLAPQFAIRGELAQIDRQEAIRRQGIAEQLQAEIDRRSTRVDALKQQLQFNRDNLSTLATLQKLTTPETISTRINDSTGDVFAIQRNPQTGAVFANNVGRIPVQETKDYMSTGTFKTSTGQRFYGVTQDGQIEMIDLPGAQGFRQEDSGGSSGGLTGSSSSTQFQLESTGETVDVTTPEGARKYVENVPGGELQLRRYLRNNFEMSNSAVDNFYQKAGISTTGNAQIKADIENRVSKTFKDIDASNWPFFKGTEEQKFNAAKEKVLGLLEENDNTPQQLQAARQIINDLSINDIK